MTRHDALIRLEHMRAAAKEAVELVRGRAASDVAVDRLRVLALERLIEIVGEAAAQTEPEVRASFPEIPWSRIVGMRNEIIHGYSTVDFEIVFKTVQDRLPQLIELLETALKKGR